MNDHFRAGFEKIALRDIEMTRVSDGTFVPKTPSGSGSKRLAPPKQVRLNTPSAPKVPKPVKVNLPKFKGKLGLLAIAGGTVLGLGKANNEY